MCDNIHTAIVYSDRINGSTRFCKEHNYYLSLSIKIDYPGYDGYMTAG